MDDAPARVLQIYFVEYYNEMLWSILDFVLVQT